MKLSKDYAVDFDGLYKYRAFRDGVSFFEFEVDLSYYRGDHNPQFRVSLVVLNVMVFDFCVYNMSHVSED